MVRQCLIILGLRFDPIQSIRFIARNQVRDVILTYKDYVAGDIGNRMNPLRINKKNLRKVVWVDSHFHVPGLVECEVVIQTRLLDVITAEKRIVEQFNTIFGAWPMKDQPVPLDTCCVSRKEIRAQIQFVDRPLIDVSFSLGPSIDFNSGGVVSLSCQRALHLGRNQMRYSLFGVGPMHPLPQQTFVTEQRQERIADW
ncbi:hypothetical protein SDC9_160265 [bioreactor metagenome]|uniref:Uncharacterized protein n=1 Tax=bioreactor metagenome TaxID=1076179 RepID=A0A645FEX5_9ZZZZ